MPPRPRSLDPLGQVEQREFRARPADDLHADGQAVDSGADYVARLVSQVTSPVRWDLCMATMAELGVTGILELPPAGTLTGIAKRNMPGVELFNLTTPDQIDEAREFIARHNGKA